MSHRTPVQITRFIEDNQYRMDLPCQYYGDEPNSRRKDWDSAKVRTCIFASWPYEQAAGNQSVPIVYATINDYREDFLCDRSYFMATSREMRLFESAGIPVFGLESRHQLRDFDVIGTSISYPVLIINFIKQLMMSDIPLRWKDRQKEPEKYPMVIVGGQAYGAPEPLAPIVDAFFCGEVEDEPGNPGIGAVHERIVEMKETGLWFSDREECYKQLAIEFNFLYFPRFIDIHYGYEENRVEVEQAVRGELRRELKPSKQVVGYSSNLPGMRLPVLKRIVKDMNAVAGLEAPPLLYIDPGMGSGDLEVGRGCPAWCSFCALTYRQKPYRQRDVDFMVKFGQTLVKNTGGVHVAPFSPDFPMHTQKKRLVSELLKHVTDEVDASSMRVDDFIADSEYILLSAHGGMDQVTLGVEGNSQRMRDLVGKGCADEDIIEAVARGIRAGIRRFKLYMICDLPGEDEGDIYKILQLAKKLADVRDSMGQSTVKIQFSWTPLLIEANTPFQWFAPTASNRALGDVWEEFRDIKIDFKLGGKAQKDKLTCFQICQRASRDVGEAFVDAMEELGVGCWGGVPKGTYELIERKMKARGFLNGYADAFDERKKHDMFGWEFIDQGINSELLWITYQQMKEFLENTDSKTYDRNFGDDYHGNEWIERCDTKCYGKTCGTCDVTDLQIRRKYIQGAAEEVNVDLLNVKVIDQKSVAMKARLKLYKHDEKRFIMNDHWKYQVRRAAYRAGLPITKRTVRFASDAIKYKDWTSGTDFVEFGLTRRITQEQLEQYVEKMNNELVGMRIDYAMVHPASSDALRDDVDLSLFEMEVDIDHNDALVKLQQWLEAEEVPMILREESRRSGSIREEVNAKDYVEDLWLVRRDFRLYLRMLLRGKPSPYNVYAAFTGRASWIDAAKYPAVRIEAFVETDHSQIDFFRPTCCECGRSIPVNPLDQPYNPDYCPTCLDRAEGTFLEAVSV